MKGLGGILVVGGLLIGLGYMIKGKGKEKKIREMPKGASTPFPANPIKIIADTLHLPEEKVAEELHKEQIAPEKKVINREKYGVTIQDINAAIDAAIGSGITTEKGIKTYAKYVATFEQAVIEQAGGLYTPPEKPSRFLTAEELKAVYRSKGWEY
jgi:hypothetical protein